jgi:Uma2 family endonuclease
MARIGRATLGLMEAPTATTARLTAEEAWRLNSPGRWELVDGQVVGTSPAGALHGRVVARAARLLGGFVEERNLGEVLAGDPGFILRRNPDTVRGPDVAFVSAPRLPGRPPAEFISGPPDLAIEVMSPSEDWRSVDRKAAEFLAAGAVAVWVVDPGAETAKAYTGAGVRVLSRGESLSCPELLGAFELRLADLWR